MNAYQRSPHGGTCTDSDTEYALATSLVVPKQVRLLEEQLPDASGNLWKNVTEN